MKASNDRKCRNLKKKNEGNLLKVIKCILIRNTANKLTFFGLKKLSKFAFS